MTRPHQTPRLERRPHRLHHHPETKPYTEDATFRAVSAFLRGLGWDTGKTNHELRKYAGSQIAMRYGIYDAQCWLRHSTVKVTEQHYTGYVKRFKPADLTTIAAHWATLAPAAPILRIVDAAS
jgi:integrase